MIDIRSQMVEMGQKARQASAALARLSTEVKNRALIAMADALIANRVQLPEGKCPGRGARP